MFNNIKEGNQVLSKLKVRGINQRMKAKSAKLLVFLALIFMPASTFGITQQEAQSEIDKLNAQNQAAQSQITQLQGQKRTLANEISLQDAQIYQLQLQINEAQARIGLLAVQIEDSVAKIAKAELDLKTAREQMGNLIAAAYEEGQVSNIELIVKAKNFSEFVDRTEYMETVQLKIKDAADKITALKTELQAKKAQMESEKKKAEELKSETISQQALINIQRQQKNNLLAQTQGSENTYQSIISSNKARMGVLACIAAGGCQSVANGDLIATNTPLYYNQTSSPWGGYNYTQGRCYDCTIANYGCLITSLAMYHGVDPITEARRHSYTWDGLMLGGFGQNVTGNWGAINSALAQGRPVVFGLNMGPYGTHFVLAKSTSAGKYYINDPYFGSGHSYSANQIFQAVIPY